MNAYQRYKKIIEMWPTHTAQEIADELEMSRANIYCIINRMRNEGIPLEKKKVDAIKRLKEERLNINKK